MKSKARSRTCSGLALTFRYLTHAFPYTVSSVDIGETSSTFVSLVVHFKADNSDECGQIARVCKVTSVFYINVKCLKGVLFPLVSIQSSVSSSTVSQQGLLRKAPVAVSTPVTVQASSSSGPKTNLAVLKPTAPEAATSSVTDNEVTDSNF